MSELERFRLIRSHMSRHGLTYDAVCDQAKVSRQRVYDVFKGKAKGYRIRRVFSGMCGVQVQSIWPDTPPQYREAA